MSKSAHISGREDDSTWNISEQKKERIQIADRDGTDLQPMLVKALQQAGASSLATQIDGLTVVPEVGYNGSARRSWSLTNTKGGFEVKVLTKIAGQDVITGDYEAEVFANIQAAVAGLVDALGAPVFAAQITAL